MWFFLLFVQSADFRHLCFRGHPEQKNHRPALALVVLMKTERDTKRSLWDSSGVLRVLCLKGYLRIQLLCPHNLAESESCPLSFFQVPRGLLDPEDNGIRKVFRLQVYYRVYFPSGTRNRLHEVRCLCDVRPLTVHL